MSRSCTTAIAFVFSLLVPMLGLTYLGPFFSVLFLIGYLGGFFLWIRFPTKAAWAELGTPYWLTAGGFLLHKVEENRTRFFEVVSEKITHVPTPDVTIGLMFSLLILPVSAWIAAPFLIKRGNIFGHFLLWTFFASMGITELAHFFLPFLTTEPYGYFPGMASVFILAPLAWWGMFRLRQR